MPSDKLMKLFIIQSISAFVANDYDTGVHFLSEIKQAYAEHMGKLNPTLKQLAKEIIQAVDMFNPDGSGFLGASLGNSAPEQPSYSEASQPSMPSFDAAQGSSDVDQSHQSQPDQPQSSPSQQPKSVAHELQELLRKRKEKRRK